MKNRIIKLSALLLLVGITSCEMEMNSPEVVVAPVESEFVKQVGNTVYVLKNSPLYFSFSGNPDNVAFWSGEKAHEYKNRSRTIIENPCVKAKLSFDVLRKYGPWKNLPGTTTVGSFLKIYYTTDHFELERDFKKDSTTLRDTRWTELLYEGKSLDPEVRDKVQKRLYQLEQEVQKPFRLAIKLDCPAMASLYPNPKDVPTNTQSYFITAFQMENVLEDGSQVLLKPAAFGLQTIFMSNYYYAPYYAKKVGSTGYPVFDPFWSYIKSPAMPKTNYLWDLTASGSATQALTFNGGADIAPENPLFHTSGFESWLFTEELDLNRSQTSPDTGVAIKEVSSRLTSYRYYYKETGKYKATFVPTSVTIEASKAGQLIEFDIEVVDVLPQ